MKSSIRFFLLFFVCAGHHLFAYKYELSVAAMFRDEAPYLREWIEYHRMVGVEHFWLYVDMRNKDDWKSVLEPYIAEGLVEVTERFVPGGPLAMYIQQQCESFEDALVKSEHLSKWIAFIDIDEFLLPMKDSTVTECLSKYFNDTDAVYVSWRNFGTSRVDILPGDSVLFKLSQCSQKSHPKNGSGKTIVRPDRAVAKHFWSPHFCLIKDGAHYVDGNREIIPTEPISTGGINLKLKGKCFDRYLRINHYPFRGENFFRDNRLMKARLKEGEYPEELLWEQYNSFLQLNDYDIMKFIRKHHPKKYQTFWSQYNQ